jgi:hypothetical protein
MRARLKRPISVALAIVALYVVVYVALSRNGGYVLTQSGQVRYVMGLAMADVCEWQPRFGFCQRFRQVDGSSTLRADSIGYVFAPLILFDQRFVHRTVRLIDLGG